MSESDTMPCLLVDGQEFPLDGPVSLGRQRSNDIQVKDEAASRFHARVFERGGVWLVEDLGSANGTRVGGKRITAPVELIDGTVIAIGRTRIVMRLADPQPTTVHTEAVPPFEIETDEGQPGTDTRAVPGTGLHQAMPGGERPTPKGGTQPLTPPGGSIPVSASHSPHDALAPVSAITPGAGNQPVRSGGTSAGNQPVSSSRIADLNRLAGRTFGGVRLEIYLNRDRLGAVYRGTQVAMQRHVAVKIFDPAVVGGDERHLRDRFLKDMSKLSALRHEAMVRVHDSGITDGLPWVATELPEGESLLKRLARGPLSPNHALLMASQILGAMRVLHESGFVHGQLRTESIFVDDSGRAQLADLGAVGMSALPDPPDSAPAELAWFVGPFPVKNIIGNPRNDLYALGVILYQALTGKLPFTGRNAGEVLRGCKDSPLPPVNQADWPPGINVQKLESLLKGLLGKDPTWHYATPTQISEELDPLIGDTADAMRVQPKRSLFDRLGEMLGLKWKTVLQIGGIIAFVLVVFFLMSHLRGVLA